MPYTEPDWDSLSEINFILYRRMSDHLNAALAAISLLGAPEAQEDPEFWRERALNEVMRSLGMHSAWASLVRYQLGEQFLPQHLLQFRASEMLQWLTAELQLINVPPLPADMLLFGNRESLQEALLLLHSCAGTLGPGVMLQAQVEGGGMWFRVRYQSIRKPPTTLDELLIGLERLPETWRTRNAIFELKRARDFLTMNKCELQFTVEENICELAFFVNAIARLTQEDGKLRAIEISSDDTSIGVSSFTLTDYTSTSDIRVNRPRPSKPASESD